MAEQALAYIDAAEPMASCRKPCRLGLGQVRKHHPFEPAVGIDRVDQVAALRRVQQLKSLQRLQRRRKIGNLLGNRHQFPCRQVFCEQLSVAIENQAPRRRQGFDSHPIALGQFRKGFVVGHLDMEQPPDQHAAHGHDENGREHQP